MEIFQILFFIYLNSCIDLHPLCLTLLKKLSRTEVSKIKQFSIFLNNSERLQMILTTPQ